MTTKKITIEEAATNDEFAHSGLFDAYPRLNVILGHMGEFVPFSLWRFDDRYSWIKDTPNLQQLPSHYAKNNMMVTTSGVCSYEALICTQIAVGSDRILFAVDYPYQFQKQAADWIESTPISDSDRELICHGNAERIFKLTPGWGRPSRPRPRPDQPG